MRREHNAWLRSSTQSGVHTMLPASAKPPNHLHLLCSPCCLAVCKGWWSKESLQAKETAALRVCKTLPTMQWADLTPRQVWKLLYPAKANINAGVLGAQWSQGNKGWGYKNRKYSRKRDREWLGICECRDTEAKAVFRKQGVKKGL